MEAIALATPVSIAMICIAMGQPDPDFAANDVKSVSEYNGNFVTYTGFELTLPVIIALHHPFQTITPNQERKNTVAKKYYVIWEGRKTGIFEDWPTAQAAVAGHKGAKFKGFETRALAEAAFSQAPEKSIAAKKSSTKSSKKRPAFELDQSFDIHIFCDGGCDPNPGPAASGVIVYQSGAIRAKYHGRYHQGTNNTAELKALFEAMRLAKGLIEEGLKVQILSDSSYSVKAMTQWAAGWQRKNWTRGKGEVLANSELIKSMYERYVQLPTSLSIIHVKGHSGVEGNELADRMCFIAMQNKVEDFAKYEGNETISELLALNSG